ncbi:MAG TPA: aminotransferase class I/II-fold pyridoxal phosphate-dependent enzyme [Acidimicrobiales bacterium]
MGVDDVSGGFQPPPYPYDRLVSLRDACDRHSGGVVDCSIGTPCDAPAPEVLTALAGSGSERGYPTSAGSEPYRDAASAMLSRCYKVDVALTALAACVGTKEFVASLAHYLALRDPSRDTVLYPGIAYPTYAVSAQLAGLRGVPVDVVDGRLAFDAIDDETASRALVLWVNSPSNPTGRLDDLEAAAAFGRRHGIAVCSDECYADYTWTSERASILQSGDAGVLAVHSLSKRSNLAGVRAGFYAGDPDLVAYLRLVRQHAGLIVAGPVQAAAAVAWSDDDHVEAQRERYGRRLAMMGDALAGAGYDAPAPEGSFYLWVSKPGEDDGWQLAAELAERAGMLVSPGSLFGDAAQRFVRVAMVQPDERLELVRRRLGQG